jgi:hypothetical protein
VIFADVSDLAEDLAEEVFWLLLVEESVLWLDDGVEGDCANDGAKKMATNTE